MQTMNSLAEMASFLPETVCSRFREIVLDLEEYWDTPDASNASFTKLFDSPVYLVETITDFSMAIASLAGDPAPSPPYDFAAFDVAYWTPCRGYAVLGSITTTDGGPQFVIPHNLALQGGIAKPPAPSLGEEADKCFLS